jgi:outer membrane receptor for ferric coprogen and ferric-rhodotorulic acid
MRPVSLRGLISPRGAAVGGSVQYVADREEPFAGIRAPAYTVVDAYYFQQLAPWARLSLKIENAFHCQYAASSLFAARAGHYPGQPRTASLALTLTARTAPTRGTP